MPPLVITTARKVSADVMSRARHWARLLDARVVARNGRSIEAICREEGVEGVLTVQAERVTYHEPGRDIEYFFHPNLAAMRIRNIERGAGDHMVEAMALRHGDEVLDCTMGRAADAIIAAFSVGETGHVVAVEKEPVIAHLTIEGLRTAWFVSERFTALMRRVDARCADYNDFLPACDADSFDVVYFDPVFHRPVEQSQSMEDLRALAHREEITPRTLRDALRVARRCVVIKQRQGTPLWEHLGVSEVHRGRRSRVEYGVIRVSPHCS